MDRNYSFLERIALIPLEQVGQGGKKYTNFAA